MVVVECRLDERVRIACIWVSSALIWRGLEEMKELAQASDEAVLPSWKMLQPPSSNNGQPSRRATREGELWGRGEGVSMPHCEAC